LKLKNRWVYSPGYYSIRRERRKQAQKSRQTHSSAGNPKPGLTKLKHEEVLLLNAIRNRDRRSGVRSNRVFANVLIASFVLHIIALSALAWVKVYIDKDIESAKVPVTFVEEQKTRVIRRSAHVRPAASLDKSPQSRPSGQRLSARVDYGTFSDFHVSGMQEKVFSQVKSLGNEVLHGTGIQRPSVALRQDMTRPMVTELRATNTRSSQAQLGISGGHELFGNSSLELAKPEVSMGIDVESILQRFFDVVRSKIESQKSYPISARDARIEGRSGIRITILKDGKLEAAEIVDSSGYAILDNAALLSVRNAAPFPPIPEGTGRDRIRMHIYLVFKIA
jgi:TonB family protein